MRKNKFFSFILVGILSLASFNLVHATCESPTNTARQVADNSVQPVKGILEDALAGVQFFGQAFLNLQNRIDSRSDVDALDAALSEIDLILAFTGQNITDCDIDLAQLGQDLLNADPSQAGAINQQINQKAGFRSENLEANIDAQTVINTSGLPGALDIIRNQVGNGGGNNGNGGGNNGNGGGNNANPDLRVRAIATAVEIPGARNIRRDKIFMIVKKDGVEVIRRNRVQQIAAQIKERMGEDLVDGINFLRNAILALENRDEVFDQELENGTLGLFVDENDPQNVNEDNTPLANRLGEGGDLNQQLNELENADVDRAFEIINNLELIVDGLIEEIEINEENDESIEGGESVLESLGEFEDDFSEEGLENLADLLDLAQGEAETLLDDLFALKDLFGELELELSSDDDSRS